VSNGNAPAFFLSYARAPVPEANAPVERFFDDLRKDVSQLVALMPGDENGFMDRNLEAGIHWEPELLRMVGTCRVFIALLSDPYLFRSKWCAMEWDLYAKRTVTRKGSAGTPGSSTFAQAILPVIWAPISAPLPDPVSRVQQFMPSDLPDRYVNLYRSDGVLGTMNVDAEAYRAVTWKLALEIQKAVATYDVTPVRREKTTGLRRTFRGGKR
jgi:hypothetical protein